MPFVCQTEYIYVNTSSRNGTLRTLHQIKFFCSIMLVFQCVRKVPFVLDPFTYTDLAACGPSAAGAVGQVEVEGSAVCAAAAVRW